MVFSVSYRDKSGEVRKKSIEAANRGECIAICKKESIVITSIQEVSNSSKSTKETISFKQKSNFQLNKNLWISFIVIVFAVVLGLLPELNNTTNEQKKNQEKPKNQQIEKKTPKVEKVAEPIVTNKIDKLAKLRSQIYVDDKGVRRWPGGLRVVDEPPTFVISNANDIIVKGRNINRQIFKYSSENQIAGLLKIEIGEMVMGSMTYGQRFIDDFKKSLKEEIQFNENDSDEDIELKKAVIDTKKELLARMQSGEDIGKIMSETRKELQDIARYRQTIRQDLMAAIKDENMTEQDIDDFVSAANQLLVEKNAKPLAFPSLLRRKIQMRDMQRKGKNK